MSVTSKVLRRQADVRTWQEELYRDVHEHPELSHQEHRTAALVVDRLQQAGFDVHAGLGGTGVVGILTRGAGPTVLLRADMDALPAQEATGLAYASTAVANTPDGQAPVMHACGHDMHVATLAGAADLLAGATDAWHGTVVVLFQPAEETGDGARGMVDDGLPKIIPAPDVALAQHILPAPAGMVGTHSGPVLSAADSMRITVHGRGGHGSMPPSVYGQSVVKINFSGHLRPVESQTWPVTWAFVGAPGGSRCSASSPF